MDTSGGHIPIDPRTTIGPVALTVSDLDRSLRFYERDLGLVLHHREGPEASLGTEGADLLLLTEHRAARRVARTTGLYHFAILLPSRAALARALAHLLARDVPLQGASDHLVSEALYLADPDGNGIELYRDRPRGEWVYDRTGLRMTTEALDLGDLLAELEREPGPWRGLPAESTMGHIHLHVADLGAAEAFYAGVLGFDVVTRYGRSASFLSAGGYHHHIGINTWVGAGAPTPPPDAVGLREFVVRLPDRAALGAVIDRLRAAGVAVEDSPAGVRTRDPSANTLRLTVA